MLSNRFPVGVWPGVSAATLSSTKHAGNPRGFAQKTLDETYELVFKEINKANREHARRLLQCITIASRPLRVDELAEILAIDCAAPAHGGTKFRS